MMFAIMSVPLLIGVGMAVDINRGNSLESRLQDAVDAAVLHTVQMPLSDEVGDDGESSLQKKAKEVFLANLNIPHAELLEFKAWKNADGTVSIDVVADIPATFAQVGGFPKMTRKVSTQAAAESGEDLEIVIAFDTTNSMGFDNTWTNAMNTLNAVLTDIDQYTGENNFFVSLVPFADRVNVGTSRTNWLSGSEPANWNGCVEPREETGTLPDGTSWDWILTDDKPTGGNRFSASIPTVTGGLATRGGNYPHCPVVSIVPPTNNVQTLITAANGFTKSGTGRFDVGMAWAWRMMSSEWRGHWSAGGFSAANATKRRQIAIMVTDGRTNAYAYEVDEEEPWGWNNGSEGGFTNLVNVCAGMKSQGMEIFMIRIDGNEHAKDYMKTCATSDDHYMEVSDNADLELAFHDVLKVVKANVRLMN